MQIERHLSDKLVSERYSDAAAFDLAGRSVADPTRPYNPTLRAPDLIDDVELEGPRYRRPLPDEFAAAHELRRLPTRSRPSPGFV